MERVGEFGYSGGDYGVSPRQGPRADLALITEGYCRRGVGNSRLKLMM